MVTVNEQGDAVCQHGTAMDVHCCNCHSGFLFDADSCVCGDEARKDAIAKVIRETVRGHLCADDPLIGKIAQALTSYEIKAGPQ